MCNVGKTIICGKIDELRNMILAAILIMLFALPNHTGQSNIPINPGLCSLCQTVVIGNSEVPLIIMK